MDRQSDIIFTDSQISSKSLLKIKYVVSTISYHKDNFTEGIHRLFISERQLFHHRGTLSYVILLNRNMVVSYSIVEEHCRCLEGLSEL